jgi:hypothetical protein
MSKCRFSHDTPSPEALAIVQEQWKNGGIKVARDTIESCELTAFDAFMGLNRRVYPPQLMLAFVTCHPLTPL